MTTRGKTPTFFYPPRPTQPRRSRKNKPSTVLCRLESLRCWIEEMTDEEREVNLGKTWIPRLADIDFLLNPTLRQRDRVEAIIVFHKRDVKGDSPTLALVGEVLGISRQVVQQYAEELVKEGRARHEAMRYVLTDGQYLHPLLRSRNFQGMTA